MKEEVWKPVVGYEGFYEVSNLGRVRSVGKEVVQMNHGKYRKTYYSAKIITQFYHWNGYLRVHLTTHKKTKSVFVHRLVAQAFIPTPNENLTVNHKNGKKDDNRLENLEWCTQQENINHAIKTGLIKNRKKPVCKLDENGVVLETFESAREASESLGKPAVCGRNIRAVCSRGYGHFCGFRWKWLEETD